jgi:hypothetical protein
MWIINRTLFLTTTLAALALSTVTLGSMTPFVIQENAPDLTLTAKPSYSSKIFFRGEQLAQSSFELPLVISDKNFEAEVTSSGAKAYTQVNYHASYAFTLDSIFLLAPDLTLYTCPIENKANISYLTAKFLGQNLYRSHLEPGLSATYTLAGIKLNPHYYYDITLHGSTYELVSSYSLPLLALGTEIDFFSTLGVLKQTQLTPSLNSFTKSTHYQSLGFLVPYQISQTINLSVSWVYVHNSLSLKGTGTSPVVIRNTVNGVGVFKTGLEFRF